MTPPPSPGPSPDQPSPDLPSPDQSPSPHQPSTDAAGPDRAGPGDGGAVDSRTRGPTQEGRDLAEVPAAEVVAAAAVHLMSAAAVKCGLAEPEHIDLDEARKLITALAGLVEAARPDLGVHAAPLRDGLQSLQRAFREASPVPDEAGEGPGERLARRR